MTKLKQIALCADDYGLNSSVTQAILFLIDKKRLSATSVMVNTEYFQASVNSLKPHLQDIEVGLHFNLTEGTWLTQNNKTLPSLNDWIIRTHLRFISKKQIATELCAQVDKFYEAFGQYPDYIDGHQHIHQLPCIRDEIVALAQQKNLMVRNTYPLIHQPNYWFKALILKYLGGKKLNQLLNTHHIRHNPYFAGIHHFDPKMNIRDYFTSLFSLIPENTLIMCHPALAAKDEDSPDISSRINEWEYLASEKFIEDLRKFSVNI